MLDETRPVGWHPGLGDIDAPWRAQDAAVGQRDGPAVRLGPARVDAETWARWRVGLVAAPGRDANKATARRWRLGPSWRDATGPARTARRVRHRRGVPGVVRADRAQGDGREVDGTGPQPAPAPRPIAWLRLVLRLPHRSGGSGRPPVDPRGVSGERMEEAP